MKKEVDLMKRPFGLKTLPLCIGSTLLMIALTACAGRHAKTETTAAPEKAPASEKAPAQATTTPTVVKLPKRYSKVLFYSFSSTPEIAKDYPSAAADVQHSAMAALSMKHKFRRVGMAHHKTDSHSLLVKVKVIELRIVSSTARIWAGFFAGSSDVTLDVQLIDGASRKAVRQEKLSSANNAWAAAYSGGSTDQSLLSDMGKILADYITAVNYGM
jgi:Domain of unknown function (DUF4410)